MGQTKRDRSNWFLARAMPKAQPVTAYHVTQFFHWVQRHVRKTTSEDIAGQVNFLMLPTPVPLFMDVIGLESCSTPLHGRVFESGAFQQPFAPKGSYANHGKLLFSSANVRSSCLVSNARIARRFVQYMQNPWTRPLMPSSVRQVRPSEMQLYTREAIGRTHHLANFGARRGSSNLV